MGHDWQTRRRNAEPDPLWSDDAGRILRLRRCRKEGRRHSEQERYGEPGHAETLRPRQSRSAHEEAVVTSMPADYLAFDLGAESGRAILGRFQNGLIELKEISRFQNLPVSEP